MCNRLSTSGRAALLAAVASLPGISASQAQTPLGKKGGSDNVELVAHLPLSGYFTVAGVDIEQELARPYVYVSGFAEYAGFTVISVKEPHDPKVVYEWKFPGRENRVGLAGENGRYFKLHGRYYYAKTVQYQRGTPGDDLGLIVFDVTGLPDGSTVREVARIAEEGPRVVHVFPYRHSDGRTLLVTTPTAGPYAQIFDAAKLLSGPASDALVGVVPVPETPLKNVVRGYHDTYVAYDPATRQDKLYGAGAAGFHVFDITRPAEPQYLFSMSGGRGVVASGHTVIATPDARYAVGTVERQFWPVMVFDMTPGLRGETKNIAQPVGAWTADWQDASHIVDVRWPYVFVAAFEDGLQIFNMVDPKNPTTEGWYYTCACAHRMGWGGFTNQQGTSVLNGAADIDIRNADGLIVMTDYTSGFWAFRLEGFDGWNGRHWKVPNVSTEQDWDAGPVPAAPREVSSG